MRYDVSVSNRNVFSRFLNVARDKSVDCRSCGRGHGCFLGVQQYANTTKELQILVKITFIIVFISLFTIIRR